MKTRLALEREVLKALPTGYTYSEEDALASCRRKFRISRRQSLTHCVTAVLSTWIYINGKTTYSRTFYDTHFGRLPGYRHSVQASRRRTKVIVWNFCAKMYAT